MSEKTYEDKVHDIFNRMRKNYDKGIGIRLSAEELHTLNCWGLGEFWGREDPRKEELESKS